VSLAILVLGPDYELSAAAIEALGKHLLGAARKATALVGGKPPEPDLRGT
jgi:hypothetical protein